MTLDELISDAKALRSWLGSGDIPVAIQLAGKDGFTTRLVRFGGNPVQSGPNGETVLPIVCRRESDLAAFLEQGMAKFAGKAMTHLLRAEMADQLAALLGECLPDGREG